ncbi:MAG: GIY-YIG nuclease family protein [Candidatus Phocaeicola faecigallinarum]|uniref:GIY-YIG nuclease family protein n=2 Tax=Bacteroidaceae TaxID=815 RepID=A0A948TA95_9BACT|nr:GIY-YIG nuclease family protein [Candidatus Phocaeicola faecigallinarum]
MEQNFFPQRPTVTPTIYAYKLLGVDSHKGYLKVGYTDRTAKERIDEQLHTSKIRYEIVLTESAMTNDGSCFTDKNVHKLLERKGFHRLNPLDKTDEWFDCSMEDVKAAILSLRTGSENVENRTQSFGMRPEQFRAVEQTKSYFEQAVKEEPNRIPKFLWNAKMRFGKTFASYQLAKKMNLSRILVLTFKPAVESAWREDLVSHIDFEGWQFISNKDARDNKLNMDEEFDRADKSKPIVVFGSFQDLLGTNESGGIKTKNEFIHATLWDLVIFDEYHFGAWKERAKELFEKEDEENEVDFDAEKYQKDEASNAINETWLPISTKYYLFLSGTPFRAINNGEFIEEQIFNWTYSDEQRAKANWKGADNPYLSLPRMVMLTYRMPGQIQDVARQGEFDEFDLNLFFAAEGKGDSARFKYENEVQKWLDLIRGAYLPASIDDLKLGQDKRPPMPFSDARLLGLLSHTLWFLPNVASCFAMANLLKQRQNRFYHDYNVIVCAGTGAGIGLDALYPVQACMGNPLKTKTITLTCGKLTTGVTVKPWTGIFMLRNLKSPETYFQAAFRVQSPWEVRNETGDKTIMKKECYVFDFALDRALRQISDYSCRLDINESNPEAKVGEFIKFLPVLAYDGSSMKEVNAQDILDIALAGTSATLLAKRWESALLVNVDNDTLKRLLDSPEAMKALMNIEGFRNLNNDLTTIINKSEAVKKAKKEKTEASQKEKKELSDEEKEIKSKRKQIQEKLIKFATRIPVFMYLTDYRERCLKDVITQLEPGLFKKVTGLSVEDFNMLCTLGVFNAPLMNDAIFKFKRYEDASLTYTGINRHTDDEVGGWDTTIRKTQYERLFYNQQSSMLSVD